MNNVNQAYSPINKYKYADKPAFISVLDVFSTPARRFFGGRTIDLIKQTSNQQLSTAGKVAAVFFSFVFIPVAIVSSSALLLKLAITPLKWEEKKVKGVVDALNLLNHRAEQLAKEGDIEKLIQELNNNPHLIRNPQVYAAVKKLVEQKLAENLPWKAMAPLLKGLYKNDRFELVSFAVEQRFARESVEKTFTMNADQIIEFAEEVFEGYKGDQITCYKRIMRNALKVVQGNDHLHLLLKIDLMDGLINKISSIRKLAAQGALQFAQAKAKEQRLRVRQFPIGNEMVHFYTLIHDKERLQKIHHVIESIRDLNHKKPELENRIQSLVAKCTTPDLWRAHQAELQMLMRDIERLGAFGGVDEEFKPLVLKLHQIARDGVAGLWEANDAANIPDQLKGVLEKTKEQLVLIQQYFEDAAKNPNRELVDKDQTFLQIHLNLAYCNAHERLADLLFLESAKHLDAWFQAEPKAS